jgi:hypothetical protein
LARDLTAAPRGDASHVVGGSTDGPPPGGGGGGGCFGGVDCPFVAGVGWNATATTGGVIAGAVVGVGIGDGSADAPGTSLGAGDPGATGSLDGTGPVGFGAGSLDGSGTGVAGGGVGPGGTMATPGVGPPEIGGWVERPPIPMLSATAARTRLTTPSASTRRSRWAAVTDDPNPYFARPGTASAS